MPLTSIVRSNQILRQIYLLRHITISFVLSMMVVAVFFLKIALPVFPLAFAILLMAMFNLHTHYQILRRVEASQRLLFVQLLFDILILSQILYFSGGATSPFTFLYLLPLAIAATVIPGRFTWMLTLFTLLAYSLLLKFYVPLNYLPHDHQAMGGDSMFNQHVVGMWFGFVLSALVVSWFVSHLARELRRREQAIAEARQREIRDQQLITLGTLAAGTAHELGTPLASLSLLVGELTEGLDRKQHAELFENQQVMKDQIQRCKSILQRLSDSTGQVPASEGKAVSINEFIDTVIAQWQQQNQHQYMLEIELMDQELCLLSDQTITQALINLLNNAAEISSEPIVITVSLYQQSVHIQIDDKGPGISDQEIAMAGEVSFSNKPGGLGIGLYIAITTLRRIGAEVIFNRMSESGTRTLIRMPIL